jgi:hypothetical protein
LFPLLTGTRFESALVEVQARIRAVVELLERGDDKAATGHGPSVGAGVRPSR